MFFWLFLERFHAAHPRNPEGSGTATGLKGARVAPHRLRTRRADWGISIFGPVVREGSFRVRIGRPKGLPHMPNEDARLPWATDKVEIPAVPDVRVPHARS